MPVWRTYVRNQANRRDIMESLIDALTLYAAENLISRFQQETAVQTRAAWREVDWLTNQLETVSPEAKKWMEALKEELLKIDINQERAVLLAGISIGLELGRL